MPAGAVYGARERQRRWKCGDEEQQVLAAWFKLVRCWHHDVITVTKNNALIAFFGHISCCSSYPKVSHMSQIELVEHHPAIPPSRQPDNLSQVPASRMRPYSRS